MILEGQIKPTQDGDLSRFTRFHLCTQTKLPDCCQRYIMKDVIQQSHSTWAFPVVLVYKKDGSVSQDKRIFSLPCIDDTLVTLSGSMWFSTLDLMSDYWQVEVENNKTDFCKLTRLFEFKVIPFGLCT